jgi:hypothetical protein
VAFDVEADEEEGDCLFCFKEFGSWYGALELAYGPVAVKRVASAAERDIVDQLVKDNYAISRLQEQEQLVY